MNVRDPYRMTLCRSNDGRLSMWMGKLELLVYDTFDNN